MKFNLEENILINDFVKGLNQKEREITEAYVTIPNLPSSRQQVLDLMKKYGSEYSKVTDKVEKLRGSLNIKYEILQLELQKRLYN